jgi:hypothetical protein
MALGISACQGHGSRAAVPEVSVELPTSAARAEALAQLHAASLLRVEGFDLAPSSPMAWSAARLAERVALELRALNEAVAA